MAAPSGTTWGSVAGDYGRVGLYVKLTNTNTQTTVYVETWFWSKYSVTDTSNNHYYDNNATSATTNRGSVSIKTTVASGNGWSTSNQVKMKSATYTYDRGTSAVTRNCALKLTGINRVGATMTVTKSYTIPALASYTVSYNANGGSGAPSTQTKYYGKSLTLSSTEPTRSGYTFVGWGTSAADTSSNYSAGASYTANAAITLYAIWKKTITLTYNANGGSGAPSAQSATVYNATTSYKFTLSSSKPTRTGYDFLGWSTSSTATSASYSAGGACSLSASDILYAVWKAKTYKITYNANGGSNQPDAQSYTYAASGTITLSSSKPIRTGYTFQKWNTKADGSGTSYSPGGTFNRYNSSTTLYAIWTINTYSITYNANGGTGEPTGQTKTYGQVLTLTSAQPTSTNYTFRGWSTSASATAATYVSGGSYTDNKAVTLYAVWELAYKKPTITNFSVERCDSGANITDEGTNAFVKFNWTTTIYNVQEIKIQFISGSDTITKVADATGKNGRISEHIPDIELSTDNTYSVMLSVYDGHETTVKTATVPGVKFLIDLRHNGNGASFGKNADMDGYVDFNFKTYHRHNMCFHNDATFCIHHENSEYTYRPYFRKGDTINVELRTTGYVTNSKTYIEFYISLDRPIIGSPAVSVASNKGLMLRQNGTYTHGSSSSSANGDVWAIPSSYTVIKRGSYGLLIRAIMTDTSGATNNDAIGIVWSGVITLS